jgi:acetylornithine deacetylase/succinyl-diaminopimelate desuccinylase-like protein
MDGAAIPKDAFMSTVDVAAVQQQVGQQSETIISFLREICAIPSMDSQIGPVGERVQEEMRKLGFDEVWFDAMGNTVGRIGNGPRVLVYDSHIDTVGIGNPDEWDWDPSSARSTRAVSMRAARATKRAARRR